MSRLGSSIRFDRQSIRPGKPLQNTPETLCPGQMPHSARTRNADLTIGWCWPDSKPRLYSILTACQAAAVLFLALACDSGNLTSNLVVVVLVWFIQKTL